MQRIIQEAVTINFSPEHRSKLKHNEEIIFGHMNIRNANSELTEYSRDAIVMNRIKLTNYVVSQMPQQIFEQIDNE